MVNLGSNTLDIGRLQEDVDRDGLPLDTSDINELASAQINATDVSYDRIVIIWQWNQVIDANWNAEILCVGDMLTLNQIDKETYGPMFL